VTVVSSISWQYSQLLSSQTSSLLDAAGSNTNWVSGNHGSRKELKQAYNSEVGVEEQKI